MVFAVEFAYDPAKDAVNLSKHGVPLAVGRIVIENRIADVRDPRDYGEVRRIAYGLVRGRMFVCVYTLRGQTCRLISVRKANSREQKQWLPSPK